MFLIFLLCGRTEEVCSMVKSLRMIDFSHTNGHYIRKKYALPLVRKSWVRPCAEDIVFAHWQTDKHTRCSSSKYFFSIFNGHRFQHSSFSPFHWNIWNTRDNSRSRFAGETRATNVTCIPMEKARRDLNASDAVLLPLHSYRVRSDGSKQQ